MDWTIQRTLSDRDLDEIVAIENASFSNPWTREMYVRELQNPDVSFLYVLRVPEHGIVAFCSFWLVLDEVHINNLAVRGDFRGRGVGTALLEHVIEAGGRSGSDPGNPGGAAVECPRTAAVRAARVRSRGDAPELLRQPTRRCPYFVERSVKDRTMKA